MRKRTTAEMTISRGQQGLMNVPITLASRRKFHLMQEDSVTLSFALATPYHFRIGDYIIDELFGKFVLTEEQMPGYNKSTGGYEYSLRFDKEYFLWKNRTFMLTYTDTNVYYTTSEMANEVISELHIDLRGYNGSASLDGIRIGILARNHSGSWGIRLTNSSDVVVADFWMNSEKNAQSATVNGIKLDASYRWNNMTVSRLFDIELTGKAFRNESERSRVEAAWGLTDNLQAHADELVRNIEAYNGRDFSDGYCVLPNGEELLLENGGRLYLDNTPLGGTPYTVQIHDTAVHAGEIRYINYNGVSILEAVNMMAEEFGCEWWVTYEDNVGVLHFGKCEGTGDPFDMELGVNVEMMNISRDSSSYANRVIGLGSTKNIPDSYRKTLTFEVDKVYDNGGYTFPYFADSTRNVLPSMVAGTEDKNIGFGTEGGYYLRPYLQDSAVVIETIASGKFYQHVQDTVLLNGSFTFSLKPLLYFRAARPNVTIAYSLDLVDDGGTAYNLVSDSNITYTDQSILVEMQDDDIIVPAGYYSIRLSVTITTDGERARVSTVKEWITADDMAHWCNVVIPTAEKWAVLKYKSGSYPVMFYIDIDGEGTFRFCNAVGGGTLVAPPSGFGLGSQFTLNFEDATQSGTPNGLIRSRIPTSWWLSDFDNPSSLRSIGENRLRLPLSWCPDGWLQLDDTLTNDQIVEEVVVFDKVFPKCYLRIENVIGEKKTDKTETTDGSEGAWEWTQWSFEVKNISGADFPFRSDMVKSGEKLQAEFLSEMDEEEAYGNTSNYHDGYLLAGMAFDVSYNGGTNRYTLIRNEDFGAKLPNDILKPMEGDIIVLTGWDADNMASLGLIGAAEDDLWFETAEYLDAIREGNFTFDCEMMSQWPFEVFGSENGAEDSSWGRIPYDVTDGEFHTTEQDESHLYYYVINDRFFIMPKEGQPVRIIHGGLPDGEKVSRVIGYEFKLDMPYDTPKYTIGETDAYSRLKQIEKRISRL